MSRIKLEHSTKNRKRIQATNKNRKPLKTEVPKAKQTTQSGSPQARPHVTDNEAAISNFLQENHFPPNAPLPPLTLNTYLPHLTSHFDPPCCWQYPYLAPASSSPQTQSKWFKDPSKRPRPTRRPRNDLLLSVLSPDPGRSRPRRRRWSSRRKSPRNSLRV